MKKYSYTQEGYDELLNQKKELDAQRVQAVKELATASAMGDRSENAAYRSGRQKLSGIDRQLRFINNQMRFAVVIQPRTDGIVGIGSHVLVDDGTAQKEFTVVGGYESDISKGRISQYSPIGKALMFKRVGSIAEYTAPIGKMQYKILSIS